MNTNLIPSSWYFYWDGSNAEKFRTQVLKFLNDTTTTSNKPYQGKKYPRYYGMIGGEPFMRKTDEFFRNMSCQKIMMSTFNDVYIAPKPKAIPKANVVAGYISDYADLIGNSWAVKSPDSMVLNLVHSLTGKRYSGGSACYGILVDDRGYKRAICKGLDEMKMRGVPVYSNHVISNLIITHNDREARGANKPPIPEPIIAQQVENHSHQADLEKIQHTKRMIELEHKEIEIGRQRLALEKEMAEFREIKETEKRIEQLNKTEEVREQKERETLREHPIHKHESYEVNREGIGNKALPLPPPIIIRRRK